MIARNIFHECLEEFNQCRGLGSKDGGQFANRHYGEELRVSGSFTLTPTLSPVSSTGQALRERGFVGCCPCLSIYLYQP